MSCRHPLKSWARLIQKIYEVDPLTCPKYSGVMKIISVIEEEEVIKKILKHLGLWEKKARPTPKTRAFHLRLTGGTHNIMRSCFT